MYKDIHFSMVCGSQRLGGPASAFWLWICISHKFPGDAEDVGPGPALLIIRTTVGHSGVLHSC
jgi:hypothetical protein